jgi:hypothetical protein
MVGAQGLWVVSVNGKREEQTQENGCDDDGKGHQDERRDGRMYVTKEG